MAFFVPMGRPPGRPSIQASSTRADLQPDILQGLNILSEEANHLDDVIIASNNVNPIVRNPTVGQLRHYLIEAFNPPVGGFNPLENIFQSWYYSQLSQFTSTRILSLVRTNKLTRTQPVHCRVHDHEFGPMLTHNRICSAATKTT